MFKRQGYSLKAIAWVGKEEKAEHRLSLYRVEIVIGFDHPERKMCKRIASEDVRLPVAESFVLSGLTQGFPLQMKHIRLRGRWTRLSWTRLVRRSWRSYSDNNVA